MDTIAFEKPEESAYLNCIRFGCADPIPRSLHRPVEQVIVQSQPELPRQIPQTASRELPQSCVFMMQPQI